MSAPTLRPAPVIGELTPFASHDVFVALLNALARPGLVGPLPRPDSHTDVPFPLLVPLALADVEVGQAVLAPHDGPDWQAVLTHVTGARGVALQEADVVVALRMPTPDEIRALRRGAPESPERGARLVIACAGLNQAGAHLGLVVSGPGVPGERRVSLSGVPAEVIETILAVNRRTPLGVDTYFVSTQGDVLGLPRTAHIAIEEERPAWATQR